MQTFANVALAPLTDGLPYCLNKVVPVVEGELYNLASPAAPGAPPVPVLYGSGVLAEVVLTAGPGATSPTYIILQTQVMGLGWADVSGCLFSGTSGTATFLLSGGDSGALAVQQTRAVNSAPAANFQNQMPLGGQIRFVGKTGAVTASPSPSPGPGFVAMSVTITYRFLNRR